MNGKSHATSTPWVDDDDAPELGADFFAQATPMVKGVPVDWEQFRAEVRRRGRPKSEAAKVAVKIRLDPDVLAALRASGPGWQTRINALLRERFLPGPVLDAGTGEGMKGMAPVKGSC